LSDEPVLVADLLDEVELLGAPIHVLLFILQVFLHDVEGGDVFAEVVHALAEQFDAVDGDLQVALDVLARIGEELAFGAVLVLQLAAEVEDAADLEVCGRKPGLKGWLRKIVTH